MKIITIGGATQDIIIQYEPQEMLHLNAYNNKKSYLILEEGRKLEINKLEYYTGGGATNSSVSFKRLGFDVSIICKIGTDHQGEFILNKLSEEKIDTNFIIQDKTVPTGKSFILPTLSGDRIIFASRDANTHLLQKEIPFDLIKKANYIYITSLSGKSSQLLSPITEFAKQNNIPVANNPGISQLASGAHALCKSLKNIEILILNAQEANELMHSLVKTNSELKQKIDTVRVDSKNSNEPVLIKSPISYQDIQFNIRDFFHEVLHRGPKIVVVTNGQEGVYAATKDSIYFCPSIQPQAIANTLGAGDAFGSCFVAQIAEGKSIEKSLRAGILNASSVISFEDAKTGLLLKKELEENLKNENNVKVQKFTL